MRQKNMRPIPDLNDRRGLLSRLAAYIAGVTLLVALATAGLANLLGPSEKIGSGPRKTITVGIASKTDSNEMSAATRNPVWIVPTPKYAYTAPPPRAVKEAAKTVFKPKVKPRAQPDADQDTQAYGYAGAPRPSARFQSPFFRDGAQ